MVQYDSDETTTLATTNTTDNGIKFCRLCLEETNLLANIFSEDTNGESDSNGALAQKLFELFQIKYEKTPSLPNSVCKECLEMIESFSSFRERIHKVESELQRRVATLKYGMWKIVEETPREGLNGHPGVFVPEEDAEITEVDPDLDDESSDDEFSMDSDSEAEDDSFREINIAEVATSGKPQPETLSTTVEDACAMDIEAPEKVEGSKINRVIETSMVISWNIIEKSYVMEGEPTKITYSCQYCDITFSDKPSCAEHVARHNPAGPFLCSFCPLGFLNRPELITHIRQQHESERPYICAICKKGFLRRADLQKHAIVHTGIRPFTCSICGKNFSRNTNLTKHLRIHKGIRPHVCKICNHSFGSASDLMRHSRTHNANKAEEPGTNTGTTAFTQVDAPGAGDPNTLNAMNSAEETNRHSLVAAHLQQPRSSAIQKPTQPTSTPPPPPKQSHFSRHFACEICSQTFLRGRDYQRHQALHLDTLFSCKQCGMIFSRREKLARHEQEQHAPQYPCGICRIPFTKHSDYELHMKMHELQQSVTATAQAASLLSSGGIMPGYGFNNQQQQQQQPLQQQLPQQSPSMLPPPSKEFRSVQQRPSIADMNFFSQMVPTMNLGFYSESRPDERNGV